MSKMSREVIDLDQNAKPEEVAATQVDSEQVTESPTDVSNLIQWK